jgi:hypothetical protein
MTKETSSKTYLKQPNIGTSPSDDLAELQSSSTETSIRNTTNNERHTDYELKAANKTFRSTRQDENNSISETNNKETFNPKSLSLNEGPQRFLEDCHGVGRDINVQCVLIKEMIIIVDHYTLAVRNRR